MKAAFPVENGLICPHFGHAPEFLFVQISDGIQVSRATEIPPDHEPGVLPNWIKDMGADVLVAGGLGARASQILEDLGVKVITGVSGEVDSVVSELAKGALKGTGEICSEGSGDCHH